MVAYRSLIQFSCYIATEGKILKYTFCEKWRELSHVVKNQILMMESFGFFFKRL